MPADMQTHDKDSRIAELEEALRGARGCASSLERMTAPGSRTLDDFMRDMGFANDTARVLLAKIDTALTGQSDDTVGRLRLAVLAGRDDLVPVYCKPWRTIVFVPEKSKRGLLALNARAESAEVKLEPGWLKRDIKRASERAAEWRRERDRLREASTALSASEGDDTSDRIRLARLVLECADSADLEAEDVGGARRGSLEVLREAVALAQTMLPTPDKGCGDA